MAEARWEAGSPVAPGPGEGAARPLWTGARGRRLLERCALHAWPALERVSLDGWTLRFSGGYTRRANAVIPWRRGRLPLNHKVQRCEAEYAGRGLPAVFKVLPFAGCAALDAQLAERGYVLEAPTAVQACPLGRLDLPVGAPVLSWDQPVPAWVGAHARCAAAPPADQEWFARIAASVRAPQCCAVIMADGQPVCCGMGVLESGWLGIFCLVTHPEWRCRGLARQLMGHLGGWARQRGAHGAYLQVTLANAAACHLYARLGFVEAYRYCYRVRSLTPAGARA